MAEAALFSIASKVLTTIASPAFEKAYERARSISGARAELQELRDSVATIQAVLLDAEKRYKKSAKVKKWIELVREVLYDAEDLFEMVATDDLAKQQMKGNRELKQVRIFFSKLNIIASGDFISNKVKAIRKDLLRISDEMALFGFVECEREMPIGGFIRGVETGSFVDPNEIIGRDDEKKTIIDFLCDDSMAERNISLISITGPGGIGKCALVQLVYNDAKICSDFKNRYWACVSGFTDEKEIICKIYESMTEQGQSLGLPLHQQQLRIRDSIDKKGKFLLVLEDFRAYAPTLTDILWSILSSDYGKGSKIIITSRYLSADAMRVDKHIQLGSLSNEESWELFKRFACSSKVQESDSVRMNIGKRILSKCGNFPLAIKSIASLLRIKDTMVEWKSLENEQFFSIDHYGYLPMLGIRMSYDSMPSHLKNCFAYCSLFSYGSRLFKQDLIYLWMAQGYIKLKKDETVEMAGHAYFMDLYRRSFFKEPILVGSEEIYSCKMHNIIHDLAKHVAGEESCMITTRGITNESYKKIRHVSVACPGDDKSSYNSLSLLEPDRVRSCLFISRHSFSSQLLDEKIRKFRFLRALSLDGQGISNIPSSIGEMKYLRYLNLSHNDFTHLPDSITKLLNLVTLTVRGCSHLKELPRKIGRLVSLRHLINNNCHQLVIMSPTFGELTSLEHLSLFMVSKSDEKSSGVAALAKLNLRGSLQIEWCKDGALLEHGQIPDTLETLVISSYPSTRMPIWWGEINSGSELPKLERLFLQHCTNVKHLAPLRRLPCLRFLHLERLGELEYIEDEEFELTTPFFPSLQTLHVYFLENLKEWTNPTNVTNPEPIPTFPCLSELCVKTCPFLVTLPLAPHLKSVEFTSVRGELIQQTVSKPNSLEMIAIRDCRDLTSFSGEGLTSLRKLQINECQDLRHVKVAPNAVEEFTVYKSPNLELWGQEGSGVDWDSFANLRLLRVEKIHQERSLPDLLHQLTILGNLQIEFRTRLEAYLEKKVEPL